MRTSPNHDLDYLSRKPLVPDKDREMLGESNLSAGCNFSTLKHRMNTRDSTYRN